MRTGFQLFQPLSPTSSQKDCQVAFHRASSPSGAALRSGMALRSGAALFFTALFLPALLLAGCRSAPEADPAESPSGLLAQGCAACIPDDHPGHRLRGTLAVEGSEPLSRTVLRRADAGSVALGGPRVSELRRLGFMEVEVALVEGAPEPGSARVVDPVEVDAFRILSVRGATPWTGILHLPGGDESARLHTDGGERLRLPGFRAPGGDHDRWNGAAIWVLGERDGEQVAVSSQGLIRPGPEAPPRRDTGDVADPRRGH